MELESNKSSMINGFFVHFGKDLWHIIKDICMEY